MSDIATILPPPFDECESCCKKANNAAPLLRCSSCKAKFYCSSKFQKQDWKAHKRNRSPFTLPLVPTVPERSPELDGEVRRIADLLKDFLDACTAVDLDKELSREERKNRKAECPALKALYEYEVPTAFAWKTNQLEGETPLQCLVHQLSRLFSLETVAGIASEKDRDGWIDLMRAAKFPSVFPLVVPEKVLARPGDLIPGEYRLLLNIASMKSLMSSALEGRDEGSTQKWGGGSRVEDEDENGDDKYAKRWPHLTFLLKLAKSIE